MKYCWLCLGSNQGDRENYLRKAMASLRKMPRSVFLKSSSVYETSPVGTIPQRNFLNCCAKIKTDLSPVGLMIELKRIEALAGRRSGRRWGPRVLDIDLLFYGNLRLRSPLLTLPHPGLMDRKFVLQPLAEIWPRAKPWLHRLNDPSQNVTFYSRALR